MKPASRKIVQAGSAPVPTSAILHNCDTEPMVDLLSLPSSAFGCLLALLEPLDALSLACACKGLNAAITGDAAYWRKLAERQWGAAALSLRPQPPTCWRSFVLARVNLRPFGRISPIALGQESRPDPWHHLASCMLCSRTSGSVVVHAAIARFFECFDTPSAVLEADSDALRVIIAPCGLQDSRCNAIKRMSHDFLAMDWTDVSELYGCGKFASDSWRIFCRGCTSTAGVQDVNLKRYLAWRNSEGGAAAGAVSGAAGRDAMLAEAAAPATPAARSTAKATKPRKPRGAKVDAGAETVKAAAGAKSGIGRGGGSGGRGGAKREAPAEGIAGRTRKQLRAA